MADDGDRINGWISRFVDPAKHLLSDGAARFLPTLFSPSPLLAPPSGGVGSSAAAGNSKPDSCNNTVEVDKRRDHSDGALADIEQLIKGKTFSTKEVDHLIEVLHSRAQTEETDRFQLASTPLQTPSLQTETGTTPVDIARAYMSSRTSQPGYLTSASLSTKPIVPKAPIYWPGAVTQNQEGYSTLRNRKSRYGLHSFSRTPYLRTMYTKSKSTSATPAKEAPLVRGIHRSPFAKEFNAVHPHSSKLASQILEHIDRPVTLKEKSMELKLATSLKR